VADGDADVVVNFTHDEALVLFEWVHRMADTDSFPSVTIDPAEVIALDALAALLERELIEPFDDNYDALVNDARQRLCQG
jgi:hypothetical protein